MAKKKEYADALREVLDTDIEFEKLLKDDLIELSQIISAILGEDEDNDNNSRAKPLNKLIDAGVDFVKDWDGPFIKNLREKAKKRLDSED